MRFFLAQIVVRAERAEAGSGTCRRCGTFAVQAPLSLAKAKHAGAIDPMSSRALSVLFVASDGAVLRRTSRLLTVFGYQTKTVTSYACAAQVLAAEKPDILLVDGAKRKEALELFREASSGSPSQYVYKLVFTADMPPDEVVQFLEAGVDDFLASPLEHGELLARLRTAVRVLEFERRMACRGARHRLPLVGREDFLARAENELALAKQQSVSCIAVALDHPRSLQRANGERAVEGAVQRLFKALADDREGLLAAVQTSDTAIALLFRGTAVEAAAYADRLRQKFAAGKARPEDEPYSASLSCGIAESAADVSGIDLLARAETSLALAQSSGGDCAAQYGQCAREDQEWAELASQGGLFEHTLARDIMAPCSLVVDAEESLAGAASLFEQTHYQALPVVDNEGKLAGLLTAGAVGRRLSSGGNANEPVAGVMTSDMASFDERTTLDALMEYFAQESPLAIVIVHKGRPTGLITPSILATLSEQLTTESFAESAVRPGFAGFIVPNLCGAEA
jgi:DNA-binding response OmpR family regulator/CBS domain-containing protein